MLIICAAYGKQFRRGAVLCDSTGGTRLRWSVILVPAPSKGVGAALAAALCGILGGYVSGDRGRAAASCRSQGNPAAARTREITEQVEEKKDARDAMIFCRIMGFQTRWHSKSISSMA